MAEWAAVEPAACKGFASHFLDPTTATDKSFCELQAILLVQQNKSSAAMKILEQLFEQIEPMQEHVAIRVCLLLSDLYLATKAFGSATSKCFSGCTQSLQLQTQLHWPYVWGILLCV